MQRKSVAERGAEVLQRELVKGLVTHILIGISSVNFVAVSAPLFIRYRWVNKLFNRWLDYLEEYTQKFDKENHE